MTDATSNAASNPTPDPRPVQGLHHVTCISGDPQRTHDFYAGLLGLRLVKRSVNQDDPGTYHLFYADGAGSPGSDITFFPWPRLPQGRVGTGTTTEVQLAVPAGSEGWWRERLARAGVAVAEARRGGEAALTLRDPDGLPLALVATSDARDAVPWSGSPVPSERQILGLHGVRLTLRDADASGALLERLGFERQTAPGDGADEEAGAWRRYRAPGDGASGRLVEVRHAPGEARARPGRGSVHHVAWAVEDDAHQDAVRRAAIASGAQPTERIDRFWFRSVYFREPGDVLYELATNGPGFDVDEDPERLGERLILPPWLEPHRDRIEAALPPLDTDPERDLRVAGGGGAA